MMPGRSLYRDARIWHGAAMTESRIRRVFLFGASALFAACSQPPQKPAAAEPPASGARPESQRQVTKPAEPSRIGTVGLIRELKDRGMTTQNWAGILGSIFTNEAEADVIRVRYEVTVFYKDGTQAVLIVDQRPGEQMWILLSSTSFERIAASRPCPTCRSTPRTRPSSRRRRCRRASPRARPNRRRLRSPRRPRSATARSLRSLRSPPSSPPFQAAGRVAPCTPRRGRSLRSPRCRACRSSRCAPSRSLRRPRAARPRCLRRRSPTGLLRFLRSLSRSSIVPRAETRGRSPWPSSRNRGRRHHRAGGARRLASSRRRCWSHPRRTTPRRPR